MNRMLKGIQKNHTDGSSTDVGSKEMSSMMTNLDASNQQLLLLKDKLEKAKEQAAQNEEKLAELQSKKD